MWLAQTKWFHVYTLSKNLKVTFNTYKCILGFYSEHGKEHKLKLYSPLTGVKYKSLVLVLTQIKITCVLRGD